MPVSDMREARFINIWLAAATLAILIIAALVTAVVATSGGGY